MRAIQITGSGNNTNLSMCLVPIPDILPDEVLIKTCAIGINRADIFQKQGLYAPPAGVSNILGLEISGIIEKTGSQILDFKPGDKVCALLEGGGYAQYAAVKASQIFILHDNIDFISAAAIPEAIFTSYSNIFNYAKMCAGESLLIHGGASGIGTMAIQIAREFGINCFATTGSDTKCAAIKELGASVAINYKTTDFVTEINHTTNNKGVDCIIDMVGGDYFNRNLKILAKNGRLICISLLGGAKIEANLAPVIFKNLTITGTTLRNKSATEKAIIATDLKQKIWPLLSSGKIKPVIDSVFDFTEANLAHQLMESGRHIGKIILKYSQ